MADRERERQSIERNNEKVPEDRHWHALNPSGRALVASPPRSETRRRDAGKLAPAQHHHSGRRAAGHGSRLQVQDWLAWRWAGQSASMSMLSPSTRSTSDHSTTTSANNCASSCSRRSAMPRRSTSNRGRGRTDLDPGRTPDWDSVASATLAAMC
jgi:hypothetical protein